MGSSSNFLSLISILSLILSGVKGEPARISDKSAGVGGELELKCVAAQEFSQCMFRNPEGQNLFMFPQTELEDGRIQNVAFGLNDLTGNHECSLRINTVEDKDNGLWECAVVSRTPDNKQVSLTEHFKVVVAVPPTQIYLEVDGQRVSKLESDLGDEMGTPVRCVAVGVRPAPKFVWTIGEVSMDAERETNNGEFDEKTGKGTYGEIFKYYPEKFHNGEQLKCTVDHTGYNLEQIENKENEVTADLSVTFAPNADDMRQSFDCEKGKACNVVYKFEANPKPTIGQWKIGENLTVDVGSASPDGKQRSTDFEQGDMEGQWVVSLVMDDFQDTDGEQDIKLVIENSKGKQEYSMLIGSEAVTKNPTDNPDVNQASSLTAVVVVIIILVLVGVSIIAYARVKGLLCFAVKASKDEDTEHTMDKEGSDTESTEHGVTKPADNGNKGESGNVEGATAGNGDVAKTADEGKQDDTKAVDVEEGAAAAAGTSSASNKVSMATEMTNLFAAVKKSVNKSKPEKYEQSESEAKLNEDESASKKEDGESVDKKEGATASAGAGDYAELDQKVLSSGPSSNFKIEDEQKKSTTVYAEIRPQ